MENINFTIDIREYKKNLRERMKKIRKAMTNNEKQTKDRRIRLRLCSNEHYKKCEMIAVYVSTEIEVDTRGIIKMAWRDGKKVAVPKCIDGTKNMDFYYIRSFDDLAPQTFGVLEPNIDKAKKVTDFKQSICIVPGLSYDKDGYRLGYGGGYYDRFLSQYRGKKIGIVYNECFSHGLRHGRYDVPVDMIITERENINITEQKSYDISLDSKSPKKFDHNQQYKGNKIEHNKFTSRNIPNVGVARNVGQSSVYKKNYIVRYNKQVSNTPKNQDGNSGDV